ncbi:MAG TPA: spirocyclase AveC family protein [Pseudonocardia sp.]|jgi:hypothetical protein|nr:spirocyclase AveC family protein [Pseudonocardia sp.]
MAPTTAGPALGADTRDSSRAAGTVNFWATLGGVLTVSFIYLLLRWVLSADFTAPDPGPDHYPYLWWLRTVEVASVLAVLGFGWFTVIRPWLQTRRIPFDGKLLIGLMIAYQVDPILNYYNPSFLMNAHSVNLGAWSNGIPGYSSPGQGRMAEGFLWAMPLYMYFGLLAAIIGGRVLTWLGRRLPRASNASLYTILFVLVTIGDFFVEFSALVYPQLYVFAGTPKSLTLFAGRIYQFPVYHCVFAAVFAVMITWLRQSRDADGVSAVERGLDRLAVHDRIKGLLSFLAITGWATVSALGYFLPFAWMSMQADSYPPLPSYLTTSAYCGQPHAPVCASQYLKQLNDADR